MLPSRLLVPVFVGLLLTVLPPGLGAQDEAFYGTWVLSLARSSITRGGPPKGETVVNAPEPGGLRSTLTVVSERGTSVEIHHYVFDGAFHATEGSDPRELSFRRRRRVLPDIQSICGVRTRPTGVRRHELRRRVRTQSCARALALPSSYRTARSRRVPPETAH